MSLLKTTAAMLTIVMVAWTGAIAMEDNRIIRTDGPGLIDWSNGTIQATGLEQPDRTSPGKTVDRQKALSAAKVSAHQTLLSMARSIHVSTDVAVDDLATKDNLMIAKIQEMVKKASVTNQEYLSDGTVKVTLAMALYGGFSQLVLPPEIKQIESIKPVAPSPSTTVSVASTPPAAAEQEIYSGLIVDARDMALNPALSLVIEDENGEQVYGPAFASREYAVQWGMVQYFKQHSSLISERIGNNPLMVRILKTFGSANSNMVISAADASKIRSASEHLSFLKQCRVVVLIDK